MAPQGYGTAKTGGITINDEEAAAVMKLDKEHSTMVTESSELLDSTRKSTDAPSNEYVLNVAFLSFVGFMGVQAFFAIIANSESMLADSEAMSVDALTYLFNMCAERIKNRPPTQAELQLPLEVREHRIEMKRLYLELIPPLISVTTLIIVTIGAVREAFDTLFSEDGNEEDVSAGLMLFFSGLNLVLDIVNVTCFARANQAYGLQSTVDDQPHHTKPHYNHQEEKAQLLAGDPTPLALIQGSDLAISEHETHDRLFEKYFGNVNLNMCSAWTHICADTMRSAAVLIAAFIAFTFDSVSPAAADSCAAIAVSITILVSLIPLIRGLISTAKQIIIESKNAPAFVLEA